jgi:hypothetical protein
MTHTQCGFLIHIYNDKNSTAAKKYHFQFKCCRVPQSPDSATKEFKFSELKKTKKLYLYPVAGQPFCLAKSTMKKFSIVLFVLGVIITIGLIIYYRSVVNIADSDPMTIDRGGNQVSEWPLFIGIIFTFVGAVFYYVATNDKKEA